jgi:hypothetical protein
MALHTPTPILTEKKSKNQQSIALLQRSHFIPPLFNPPSLPPLGENPLYPHNNSNNNTTTFGKRRLKKSNKSLFSTGAFFTFLMAFLD